MESIKISKDKPIFEYQELDIEKMVENSEENTLEITLKTKWNFKIGDIVAFSRYILFEKDNTSNRVAYYESEVLDVRNVLIPGSESKYKTIIVVTLPQYELMLLDKTEILSGATGDKFYLKITFLNNCNIFAQDLLQFKEDGCIERFYTYDINKIASSLTFTTNEVLLGEELKDLVYNSSNELIYPYGGTSCAPCNDFIFDRTSVTSYGCDDGTKVEFIPNYYYIPSRMDRKSLYVSGESYIVLNRLKQQIDSKRALFVPLTKFYYTKDNNCVLWEDTYTGQTYDNDIDTYVEGDYIYIKKERELPKSRYNTISIAKKVGYWNVSVGLSNDIDYKHLYQEEKINTIFSDKVKKAVVDEAPVIDMEKVKFAPYYNFNGVSSGITQIVINLHFRERKDFESGWTYNNDSEYWWSSAITGYSDITEDKKEIINKSDMLYFLGFTDDDVMYQKNKIKKSFLRLSFYDNTNQMDQRLLYYSTVFMDGGELFGKYVRAKQLLPNEYPIVLASSSETTEHCRVDSQFIIEDEFNMKKSSEGFNIYYFPSDVLDAENQEKTIYMKIEFNHAGFGRTIPMVALNEGIEGLTLDNLNDNLYIEVKLKYIKGEGDESGKYIYEIQKGEKNEYCIEYDKTNGIITLNLFEPRLTK